jgi:GMP synthase-like glutamine amidotransferase
MGFRRHRTTKKALKESGQSKNIWTAHGQRVFSVNQEYSLTGCSPAEPVSAYPDELKIIPTLNFNRKFYLQSLVYR